MNKTLRVLMAVVLVAAAGAAAEIKVVTTLPDYAAIAREIGGDRIVASSVISGAADPHHLKPKPSYALMLRDADLFVSTGLDLELWAPVVVNKSGNRNIVDGGPGYVSASHGIELLQKPASLARTAGDIHIYGNPHIQTSPINAKAIATNIATGLCKVDPAGCSFYEAGLASFNDQVTRRLCGDELVDMLGATTLDGLAREGRLVSFLEQQGMIDRLGGWLGKGLPLRGRQVVCYHKNWVYFSTLFGLSVVAYVEPKPGLPPTARHVANLIERIESEGLEVLLAANYFEERKPQMIADRTGIRAVIVPLSVGGEAGVESYFDLVDLWVDRLVEAFAASDAERAAGQAGPGRHHERHRHGGGRP